jgi:hypothetical protein
LHELDAIRIGRPHRLDRSDHRRARAHHRHRGTDPLGTTRRSSVPRRHRRRRPSADNCCDYLNRRVSGALILGGAFLAV